MGEDGHSGVFESVDALLAQVRDAPCSPAERQRLREEAGLTLQEVAKAVGVTVPTIRNWEDGRTKPQGQGWNAYRYLLEKLAEQSAARPAPPAPTPAQLPLLEPAPALFLAPAPFHHTPAPAAAAPPTLPGPRRPATVSGPVPGRLGPEAVPVVVLAAEDGPLLAHLPDGRAVPCPVTALHQIPAWAASAGLAAMPLHPKAPAPAPLVALTACATERLGLPATAEGADRSTAVHQLTAAGWTPTGGPLPSWPHLRAGRGPGVALAVLPWGALADHWQQPGTYTAADTARLLGRYTALLMPPTGTPAHCGVQLMPALRPALLEVPPDHDPHAYPGDPGPCLWWRTPHPSELRRSPHVIALSLTLPLVGAATDVRLSTAPLVHHNYPAFDPGVPGRWLVDLSDYPHDPRLPCPFTADGRPPTGPDWHPTTTVAYAADLGCHPQPTEAWLRPHSTGCHLSPWYKRLRDAHMTVMSCLGLDTETEPEDLHRVLQVLPQRANPLDRALLAMLAATEADALLGPLPDPYPAWLPEVRTALLAKARANTHRKIWHTARATGLFPLAATPHLLLYCAPSPDIFQLIPRHHPPSQQSPGLRLGVRPGSVQPAGGTTLEAFADLVAHHEPHDPDATAHLRDLLRAGADN